MNDEIIDSSLAGRLLRRIALLRPSLRCLAEVSSDSRALLAFTQGRSCVDSTGSS